MNSEVLIVPTPVKNGAAVTVKWQSFAGGNAELVIYDPTGKRVHACKLDNSGTAVIPINSWASGVYFVWLKSANTQELRKLIVD
ncbi:MAG: T9SS type A sorting domain-containing protein [Flavitalea sp.]